MNKEKTSPAKRILFVMMMIVPCLCTSQAIDRQMLDGAVDKFCECVTKATDKSELSGCKIDIDTALMAWSEFDDVYLTREIIKKCGESHARLYGDKMDIKYVDNVLFMGCTLFSRNELERFKLRPEPPASYYFPIFEQTSVSYWFEGSDSTILKLQEYRQMFSEKDIGKWNDNEQREFKRAEISHSYFDFLSVQGPRDSDVGFLYLIVARKGGLVCTLKIALKKENRDLVTQLVELLANRIRACEL
jgi:hypothetical protein